MQAYHATMKSEQNCLEIALLKEKNRLHATHTEQTITTQHDPPTEGAGAAVVRGWWVGVGVGGWVVVVVVVVWWCGGGGGGSFRRPCSQECLGTR